MSEELDAAREHRKQLEEERRAVKGPSYVDVTAARIRERNIWKASLPFYLRPWFWIVIAAVTLSIPPLIPVGLVMLVIHATWYQIARSKVTSKD